MHVVVVPVNKCDIVAIGRYCHVLHPDGTILTTCTNVFCSDLVPMVEMNRLVYIIVSRHWYTFTCLWFLCISKT